MSKKRVVHPAIAKFVWEQDNYIREIRDVSPADPIDNEAFQNVIREAFVAGALAAADAAKTPVANTVLFGHLLSEAKSHHVINMHMRRPNRWSASQGKPS